MSFSILLFPSRKFVLFEMILFDLLLAHPRRHMTRLSMSTSAVCITTVETDVVDVKIAARPTTSSSCFRH